MIAVVGVVVLAVAGLGVTVLSAVAGRHPDRAAMLVVVGAAAGGMFVFLLAAMAILVMGARGGGGRSVVATAVQYSGMRLSAGLLGAAVLLLTAGWLIKTGDWERPED